MAEKEGCYPFGIRLSVAANTVISREVFRALHACEKERGQKLTNDDAVDRSEWDGNDDTTVAWETPVAIRILGDARA